MIVRSHMGPERRRETNEHSALPETAEQTGRVVGTFEGNVVEDGVAVGEAVPVVVPSGTWGELRESGWREQVVILDLGPPIRR